MSESESENENENQNERRKRKRLTLQDKWSIVAYSNYFRNAETKRFDYGGQSQVLTTFNITKSSLTRILHEYDSQAEVTKDLTPSDRKNCGPDSMLTEEVKANLVDLLNMIIVEDMELNDEELAEQYFIQFGVKFCKRTIQNYLKILGRTTSTLFIKPTLSFKHQLTRLQFILDLIEHRGHGIYRFIDLRLELHVDEKWFYVVKIKKRVRIIDGCIDPTPENIIHKSHIPKVMFLSVIGVPDPAHGFDGKVGIFVFGEYRAARRSSRNRAAGTMEFKDIPITAEAYRNIFQGPDGVIEAVKTKMPWARGQHILIRHDGAKPHTGHGNEDALTALGQQDGWNMTFTRQPAQSPDMNKNDLCFFASLQKKAHRLKQDSKKVEDLVVAVKQAYEEYEVDTLTRIHAIQYEIYRQIMLSGGDNTYKLPHSGVRARQQNGQEVPDYSVPAELVLSTQARVRELEDLID